MRDQRRPRSDPATAAAESRRDQPARPRPSGPAGRVAAVHAQTRRGLLVAVAFVVAAFVTAIGDVGSGGWLPLHLFVAGGLLSAISTVTQMLAVTWSTAPAPDRWVAAVQRWALAGGVVALVVGREADRTWLFVIGGVSIIAAMVAVIGILVVVRHRASTDRFAPAIEAYVAAIAAGLGGMSIGVALGAGGIGERAWELRGVHVALNVFGLVGLVIAGTLPFFTATIVRSKMSPRATPAAVRLTIAGLAAATALAALGNGLDRPSLAAVGFVGYAVGLIVIVAILPVYDRSKLHWAGPRIVQLLAGIGWWAAMSVALAVAALTESRDTVILRALVIGGLAQILVASLAYLGPMLRGGGHRLLTAGFTTTRSWVSVAAGNVAAVAALIERRTILAVALAVWLADIVVRATILITKRSNDHV